MVIFETDGHLKSINKSRFLVRNKILRDRLFGKAKILINKPNAHLPGKEPPILQTIPSRRPQPVKKQVKYEPIITRNTKWSEEDIEIFMKKRFPE